MTVIDLTKKPRARQNSQKWYLSDLHLGHANILKYTPRGTLFSSIEEHDEFMINRINEFVQPHDELYFVGDVALHDSPWHAVSAVSQIKCRRKYLVTGNHDVPQLLAYKKADVFEDICPLMWVKDGDMDIILCHYPIVHWPKAEYGTYHLYGHLHGDEAAIPSEMLKYRLMDVGIDAIANFVRRHSDGSYLLSKFDYRPIDTSDIKLYLAEREVKPKRHNKE